MQDNCNFEHIVKQKCEGRALAKKIAFFIGYIALFILIFVIIFFFCPMIFLIPFGVLGIAFESALIFFTYKYMSVEYEYMITGSTITFSNIYGKNTRKHIFEADIKSFSQFARYDENTEEMLSEIEVDENYIFVSSPDSPDICYALLDAEDKRYIVYFEVPETAMNIIKKLNPSAIRNATLELKKYNIEKSKNS